MSTAPSTDDRVTAAGRVDPDGEARAYHFASAVMGGTRPFWVALPPSVRSGKAGDRRFPVVVQLDGHSHGRWSPVVADYMMRRGRIPEVILVGVALMDDRVGLGSVQRARDLTPTRSLGHYDGTENQGYRESGGAARFLRFLEEELLPHVDGRYPTLPRRVLVGQSLSGCFAFDCFVNGTSRFQAFLAMDPCLWWDGWRSTGLRDALPTGSPVFERGLFLAFSGTDEPGRVMQTGWFEALAAKATPAQRARLDFAHYGDESHISMNLPGFYQGLRFLFGTDCGLEWG